ncbi:hypothetical protein C8J57DRAFT_1054674 [Mycena rebaudengoi]|nr:hypothetical protein C8J57DRAFT_1054674 [Mycena rebaudengoi]
MEVSGTATEQTPVVASDLPPKKKKEKGKAKAPGNHHEPAALQATSGGEASTAALPAPSFISPPAGSLFPLPSYIQAPYFPAAQPTVSLFPTPVPFTDIAFGSNEDVLRALQQLDLSNVAGVLNGVPSAPTVSDLLGDNAPSKHLKHRRTLDMSLAEPSSTQQTTPAHAHLIATKWMTPPKLAELVKSEGLYYKKGKFSAIEVKQVNDAIHNYLTTRGLSEEDLQNIIFPPDEKSKDGTFWTEISFAVPQRPLVAVYHYVRRSHHPMKQQGRWRPDEDTNLLQAVASLGQQWEKVAKRVGRMATDCRDRYRNHIVDRDVRVSGPWSKEEEAELTRIVTELTVKKGKDMDNDVFWTKVTKLMGGKRSRQQCRIKWTDSLSRQYKNEGRNLRWSRQDAFILIHKIDALNVRDDSEIDWKKLPDPQWNYWSAHILQRRWLTMKKGVKEYEDMTHPEIMDILRAKNAELPKFTSKETIDDEHDDDSEPEAEAAAEAGSSTGPGTASALAVQGGKDDDDSDDSDEDSDDSE